MKKSFILICSLVVIGLTFWMFFQIKSFSRLGTLFFSFGFIFIVCVLLYMIYNKFKKNKIEVPEKTESEKINEASFEELISDEYSYYRYNIEQTKLILKKCSKSMDYLRLHNWVFANLTHPNYPNYRRSIAKGIIETIYFNLVKSLNSFLKETTVIHSEKIKVIKELHQSLNPAWKNVENSGERILLKKRLEVEWNKLTSEIFEKLKSSEDTPLSSYEELFFMCKMDDPKIFEIAEIINKRS